MVLTDAIKTARTEHVVYFLLAAYVETLDYFEPLRSLLPESLKKLPVHGKTDVVERLRALRATAHERGQLRDRARLLLDEAIAVFTAAAQRLWALQNTNQEFRRELQRTPPYVRKAAPWAEDPVGWESSDGNETSTEHNRDKSRRTVGLEYRGTQPARPRKASSTRLAHD